jgi:N-glycosylase/DNA lyase
MKRITNIIAIIITVAAWAVGMLTEHSTAAWTLMLATYAVMKLAGQVDGYPFDWLVRAWRRKS